MTEHTDPQSRPNRRRRHRKSDARNNQPPRRQYQRHQPSEASRRWFVIDILGLCRESTANEVLRAIENAKRASDTLVRVVEEQRVANARMNPPEDFIDAFRRRNIKDTRVCKLIEQKSIMLSLTGPGIDEVEVLTIDGSGHDFKMSVPSLTQRGSPEDHRTAVPDVVHTPKGDRQVIVEWVPDLAKHLQEVMDTLHRFAMWNLLIERCEYPVEGVAPQLPSPKAPPLARRKLAKQCVELVFGPIEALEARAAACQPAEALEDTKADALNKIAASIAGDAPAVEATVEAAIIRPNPAETPETSFAETHGFGDD